MSPFNDERVTVALFASAIAVGVFTVALCAVLLATETWGHSFYHDWKNKDGRPCCDNTDCRELDPNHYAIVNGREFVYVQGVGKAKGQAQWCPILAHHYLKTGNVPNMETAHICVTAHYGGETPCAQFICYQGRPQT